MSRTNTRTKIIWARVLELIIELKWNLGLESLCINNICVWESILHDTCRQEFGTEFILLSEFNNQMNVSLMACHLRIISMIAFQEAEITVGHQTISDHLACLSEQILLCSDILS